MNIEEIKKLLPHREPMLLLDSAEKISDHQAEGCYKVKGTEWFLQGHFPNNPVVPGVILCEMMAQTCCVLMATSSETSTPYFTGLDKVKFRSKVLPGDTVVFTCEITRVKHPFYFAKGVGKVEGKVAVTGEFSFLIG